jgi:hypothetical protein
VAGEREENAAIQIRIQYPDEREVVVEERSVAEVVIHPNKTEESKT